MRKLCKNYAEIMQKLCGNYARIMCNMRKLCGNYAKIMPKIMRKLCKHYAEIMRKLCTNYECYAKYAIPKSICKLCGNYAEIMRKLCGNYADMLQFPFPHDYAKIMRNYAKIMRIMRTSKNYADYADPTLLMAGPGVTRTRPATPEPGMLRDWQFAASAWSPRLYQFLCQGSAARPARNRATSGPGPASG